MVAGRELFSVVEASYDSVSIEKEIACKADEPVCSPIGIIPAEIVSADKSSTDMDVMGMNLVSENFKEQFVPIIRSGSCSDIGHRSKMEDEHVRIDDLSWYFGTKFEGPKPTAFYGVFDGHGGVEAAMFARDHLLKYIMENAEFVTVIKKDADIPIAAEKALKTAFLEADLALAKDTDVDSFCGTTVLTALILGRSLFVANAGDCRAVLCRRGKAVAMSRDHKPDCASEKRRIEFLGGYVYDGYLNGELSVARALGDWSMKQLKGSASPLTAEPEIQRAFLTEEDEFLIIGCDGLWDALSSERAVNIVRNSLIRHNDPFLCSKELVTEALTQAGCDNLTAVVVCFSSEPPPPLERRKLRIRVTTENFHSLKRHVEDL